MKIMEKSCQKYPGYKGVKLLIHGVIRPLRPRLPCDPAVLAALRCHPARQPVHREAVELRDGDSKRFGGKGVSQAVSNVNSVIRDAVLGKDASAQADIDQLMIDLDGTDNKAGWVPMRCSRFRWPMPMR